MTREEMIITARQYMLEVQKVANLVSYEEIAAVAAVLVECKENGGKVFTVGNGGSAATASHFANDLTKIANLPTISIPDLVPSVTAYGNDNGWEFMFADWLDNYVASSDLVVGFSCSGKSRNVLMSLRAIPKFRAILFTGNDPGEEMASEAAHVLRVPHDDIRIQEDVHLMLCHIIAGLVRDAS